MTTLSPPPREVIVLNDYASFNGGSSSVALASALGLARQGIKVTLFTCVGPVDPQLLGVPNLTVVCLGQAEIAKDPNRWRAGMNGWRNRDALRALRAVLAEKSPAETVVHAHTWTKALSPFALHLVTREGFPLVITLHDFFLACPNGGLFDYGTQEICTRRPLSLGCWGCNCDRRRYAHKLWRSARTWAQNRLLQLPQRAACFIAVSDFSRNLLQPHLPPGTPVHVVDNPVDAPRVPPASVAANREFFYVGRFETEKGVELFAQAVRDSGLPAVFVGDGAQRSRVKALCPSARFTGWLNADALRRELHHARALVFPPLWYETLGLVVIEAAAAGVPAIVADHCAATDYVRPGLNGLHFAHGSPAALAGQMQRLAQDDVLAASLGHGAYRWYWSTPWTLTRHVSALLKVYQQIPAATAAHRERNAA